MPIIQPNTTESDPRTRYTHDERTHGSQDYFFKEAMIAFLVLGLVTIIGLILSVTNTIDVKVNTVGLGFLLGLVPIFIFKGTAEWIYDKRIRRNDRYQASMVVPSG